MKFFLLFLALAFASTLSTASAGLIDFESFQVGSIHGQSGWSSIGPFDQAVVDIGGNKVWRISNAVTSGSFGDQSYSSTSDLVAGENGAQLYTNPTSGPAANRSFYGAWDFKSATGNAQLGTPGLAPNDPDNNNLSIRISPTPFQVGSRQSWLQIYDSGNGFDLNFYESKAGGLFDAQPTPIFSGLSYTAWHTVEMYVEFVDGLASGDLGNDIVKIFVNGALVHTGTTWETYYQNISQPRVQAVNSLLFRESGLVANAANSGNGFYFDNVIISNLALSGIPEPSSLALFCLSLGVLFPRRRG